MPRRKNQGLPLAYRPESPRRLLISLVRVAQRTFLESGRGGSRTRKPNLMRVRWRLLPLRRVVIIPPLAMNVNFFLKKAGGILKFTWPRGIEPRKTGFGDQRNRHSATAIYFV